MKKFFSFILLLTFLMLFSFSPTQTPISAANDSNIEINAPVGLLMEFSTGEIIYEKNSNEKKYPASMTKVMGLYLILNKIKDGTIKFEDIVTISKNAASMGGSQVFLEEGEQITVNDLFKSICISSANDAIVALGEYAYGSETNFVNEMNNMAKKLGMKNTNYVNPTGFHDENHYTTAKDMATLALAILTEFKDEILKYTSMYEGYIRENTQKPFWLVNTNKLVKFYDGMDGLKTGFTNNSGFCLTATAERNGLRFISIVMDAPTSNFRNEDTVKLMNYGFNTYKATTIANENEEITKYTFENSKQKNTILVTHEPVVIISKKNYDISKIVVDIHITNPNIPKNTDTIVGKVTYTNPDTGWKTTYNLYSKSHVQRLTFYDVLKNYWKNIIQ